MRDRFRVSSRLPRVFRIFQFSVLSTIECSRFRFELSALNTSSRVFDTTGATAVKERGYVGTFATHKSNAKRDKNCPKGDLKWTSRPGPNRLIRLKSIMSNRPSQLYRPQWKPLCKHTAPSQTHTNTRGTRPPGLLCPEAQANRTSGRKHTDRTLGTKK